MFHNRLASSPWTEESFQTQIFDETASENEFSIHKAERKTFLMFFHVKSQVKLNSSISDGFPPLSVLLTPDCCVASQGKGKLFLKEEEKLNERLMESLFIVFSDCSRHSSVRSKRQQPLIRMESAIPSIMTPRNRIKVFPRINHAFNDGVP